MERAADCFLNQLIRHFRHRPVEMIRPHPIQLQETGSAFVVVLVISLGLISMVLYFGNSMVMAYRAADNQLAGRQAEQAIEGATRYAANLMSQLVSSGSMPDPTSYESEAVPVGDATFWFIGSPTSSGSNSVSSNNIQTTDVPVFALVDEASKLNLNNATQAMIEQLPGMTTDLASAIVSWRRSSADTSGANSGFNLSDIPEKGAPFETTWEMGLLSTGSTQDLFYGLDSNFNHVIEPEENDGGRTFSTGDSNALFGLLEYTTVFSREPNTKPDGTPRINVQNWSSALGQLLSSTVGQDKSNQIEAAAYRGKPPVTSVLDFYVRCGSSLLSETDFDKISGSLSVSGSAYLTGLVNVNTASETVLACIPGIGNKASQLVAARQARASQSTNLAWVVPILGPAGAVQAGRYLTTKTFQVSADVAAVGRHGRGYRRTLFVLDSSTGTPLVVYRRNLTGLGWALGPAARDTIPKDFQ